jgi:hypothetical protein
MRKLLAYSLLTRHESKSQHRDENYDFYGPLQRYGVGSNRPIHIIVDRGHVTLEGVVDNTGDKNLVNIRANQVPGVFSVTNNLQVPSRKH